jgi:hypothetical protein
MKPDKTGNRCTQDGCKSRRAEGGYLCEKHSVMKYGSWLGSGAFHYAEEEAVHE